MKNRDHKPPRYLVFTGPLLPRPFWTKISSSAPYCWTSSV